MIGEHFPYTNFHDLNLDWIIKTLKETKEYVDTEIQSMEDYIQDDLPGLVQELISETVIDITMSYNATDTSITFEFTEGGNNNA